MELLFCLLEHGTRISVWGVAEVAGVYVSDVLSDVMSVNNLPSLKFDILKSILVKKTKVVGL